MQYIVDLVSQAKADAEKAQNITTLNQVRIAYMGKKGSLTLLAKSLHTLPEKDRPAIGVIINKAKKEIQNILSIRKSALELLELNVHLSQDIIDVSLPGRRMEHGGLHPITRTIERLETFFYELGFTIETGPEIEDSYYNFDALNIPSYHPARTDHDTFWFDATRLLRTQTSGIQIRTLEKKRPPIRIIASGRVYRNDYDHTHTPMFHQMEGLIIDQNINLSNMKGTLYNCLYNFFEEDLKIRFRPSYFPFTEPSAEIDVICANDKWLEILGCGMVHPKVLRNVGINPDLYSGFAFGMGIERLTMLRYNITDLRAYFENDLNFLKQFR
ncbi:Phenylalanine--tRNA ligase alpha subunit [Candidatus Profftia lariciata]|uniref:phenylalanine--tRNA ligase subunit alpha n=1 Tax=Candidatus Profftia lariciata TaxID=1987921 RepID=UPI001D01BE8C|nr:phenylalanine--tRNA ligase subunit alpha [Candidatus Profftia lariciata]UDG81519.1 Phenylalanine--tRNA ligase alpha subunit [Candidatus Profftia lariciata]